MAATPVEGCRHRKRDSAGLAPVGTHRRPVRRLLGRSDVSVGLAGLRGLAEELDGVGHQDKPGWWAADLDRRPEGAE
jgi:hypothetical protein